MPSVSGAKPFSRQWLGLDSMEQTGLVLMEGACIYRFSSLQVGCRAGLSGLFRACLVKCMCQIDNCLPLLGGQFDVYLIAQIESLNQFKRKCPVAGLRSILGAAFR